MVLQIINDTLMQCVPATSDGKSEWNRPLGPLEGLGVIIIVCSLIHSACAIFFLSCYVCEKGRETSRTAIPVQRVETGKVYTPISSLNEVRNE